MVILHHVYNISDFRKKNCKGRTVQKENNAFKDGHPSRMPIRLNNNILSKLLQKCLVHHIVVEKNNRTNNGVDVSNIIDETLGEDNLVKVEQEGEPHGVAAEVAGTVPSCDNCKKEIVDEQYKCLQCADFTLCKECETSGCHTEHCMLRGPNLLATAAKTFMGPLQGTVNGVPEDPTQDLEEVYKLAHGVPDADDDV